MLKSIEMTGENRDAAIEAALEKLGMQRDDVSVEVLDNGKKGFLGIGATPARVKVSYEAPDEPVKPESRQKEYRVEADTMPRVLPAEKAAEKEQTPHLVKPANADGAVQNADMPHPPRRERDDRAPRPDRRPRREERMPRPTPSVPKERQIIPVSAEAMQQAEKIATEFIGGLLQKMGIENQIETLPQIEADQLRLTISGPDMSPVIGRRGDTLDAVQYLTSLVLNNAIKEHVRVSVDTENYREKRQESLERLARKIALKVQHTHRSMTLEPMNPYERRIIHAALQDFKGITTYSTGTEPGRRIVIAPDSGSRARY